MPSRSILFILVLIVAMTVVAAAVFLRRKALAPPSALPSRMEKISFFVDYNQRAGSESRVKIIGNFWAGTESSAVILVHMMPETKESWNAFAEKLNKRGFHVLAIDLRGHGESSEVQSEKLKVKSLDYKNFSDEEHQASILDVEGAREWLMRKGIAPENIFVGGASIGANLALQYLAEHPEAPAGFSLSPGLDYRGIKTEPFMAKLQDSQRVFLAAAEDDEYSAQTVRALNELGPAQKVLKVYLSGGHGTVMFQEYPELMEELFKFLNQSKI